MIMRTIKISVRDTEDVFRTEDGLKSSSPWQLPKCVVATGLPNESARRESAAFSR